MKNFIYFQIFLLLLPSLLISAEKADPVTQKEASVQSTEKNDPVENLQNAVKKKKEQKAKPIRYIFYSGTRYVLLFDVADYYSLASLYTKEGVVLYSDKHRIKMFYEKREGSIDDIRTYFLAPVLYMDKRPYITESDFLRVIDPAIRTKIAQKQTVRTIMLDPGHGGSDPGAKGPVHSEKQINLFIALKLKHALEKLGFNVIMTRANDTFPTLQDRATLAEKYKPDLYLSIHCNSAANKSVSGIETFLLTPAGACSTADRTPQNTTFAANAYDRNNYKLAYEVHRSLLKFTGCEDRGVRHARFFVLRNAVCPAILIECGFLSNLQEGCLLAKNERQNKLVAGILSGLARYTEAVRVAQPEKISRKEKPTEKEPKASQLLRDGK